MDTSRWGSEMLRYLSSSANEAIEMEEVKMKIDESLMKDEKAINLIVHDQKNGKRDKIKALLGFQVSREAIELLSGVKDRIGVIAVAGKYRTGKSFLLNRIILNKTSK